MKREKVTQNRENTGYYKIMIITVIPLGFTINEINTLFVAYVKSE